MPCFDRATETSALWDNFKAGRNLLMLAPRRIGKTMLLNHLRENASPQGFRAVVLDVEGLRDEKAFFRECCAAIQEELSTGTKVMAAFAHRLAGLLRGQGDADPEADWRQWLGRTDWPEFADQLFAHLDDHHDAPPWLILIDELPVFVSALHERGGAPAIREFLYWLRGMRQKHRRIRWLYTGSIGLDTIARRNQVEGALNDLEPFALGPFDQPTARAFLADLVRRRACTLEEAAADAILARLGWLSPYYLERIVEDACGRVDAERVIDAGRVRLAMDRLLDLDKRLYLLREWWLRYVVL